MQARAGRIRVVVRPLIESMNVGDSITINAEETSDRDTIRHVVKSVVRDFRWKISVWKVWTSNGGVRLDRVE